MFVDFSHLINFSKHFKQNCFGTFAVTQVLSMSVLSPQRKIVGEFLWSFSIWNKGTLKWGIIKGETIILGMTLHPIYNKHENIQEWLKP
jgi:hypothetical protein